MSTSTSTVFKLITKSSKVGFQAYITAARVNAPATITADPKLDKSAVIYGPW
jgi:hypothetical protein